MRWPLIGALACAFLALLPGCVVAYSGFAIIEFRTPFIENVELNFHLNCRGDLVRTEIIEMDVCHPCPSRSSCGSFMIDFHDMSKASYYEYSRPGCVNVDRTKLQNVFAGGCNEDIDGAFGLVPNIRMMWKWADTRLSLASGVQGPLVEVYNNNHYCGYARPTYYIEYPAQANACINNLTDTLADPQNPVPLHYRWYFTVACMADKISMVIQEFKELNESPNITRYITQACMTDGRDSWRAGLFGCGFVNPSSDASRRL